MKLSDAGFEIQETGGGCTAWVRRWEHDGHDWEALVTEMNEPAAPAIIDAEPVRVTVFADGSPYYTALCETVGEVFSTVAEMLMHTMNGRRDYSLCEIWSDWDRFADDTGVCKIREL